MPKAYRIVSELSVNFCCAVFVSYLVDRRQLTRADDHREMKVPIQHCVTTQRRLFPCCHVHSHSSFMFLYSSNLEESGRSPKLSDQSSSACFQSFVAQTDLCKVQSM